MIHYNTKNKSFLKMHYILKEMGIKNNTFFLQLYDEKLLDIDPLDEEMLTEELKLRVHIEISKNPWYYFREIVKIPMTDVKLDFELTRATLAILWTLINDLHGYVVIPRQCYKSYTVACFYSWLIYWGSKNFSATFFAQNDGLVTQNLTRVKDIRESLSPYLNLKSKFDTDNQHSLVYRSGEFNNTIVTRAPGMNEDSANNVGRGQSTMGQWYDEFAFIPFIWVQYGAAIPAYSTVAKAAERNGSHHHIIITTTAGNKKSKSGKWAYDFFKDCAPFTELLYDKVYFDDEHNVLAINKSEILDYISNNNNGQFFLRIEYQWYELSKPVEYLDEMKALMGGLDEFNRGVLNIWSDSNEDHPLGQQRVAELVSTIIEPVSIIMIDKIYVTKFYRDPELCKIQSKRIVFGMDTSGNTRKDYSTLVGMDVTNSEVVFTMKINQHSVNRFAKAVAYILLYMFPESTLIGERNFVGIPILETIVEIIGRRRVYEHDEDKLGITMDTNLRRLMFGEIIRTSIVDRGKYIHDKDIIEEIAGLTVNKSGRIDHKAGGHDDVLISYLYCRWFVTFCAKKNKYVDAILINSALDQELTEQEIEEIVDNDNINNYTAYVLGEEGKRMVNEKLYKKRYENNKYVQNRIKDTIDDELIKNNSFNSIGYDSYVGDPHEIYGNWKPTPKINEKDISVDFIKDENFEKISGISDNLDDIEPEKISRQTEENRDNSKDETSLFSFSFKC